MNSAIGITDVFLQPGDIYFGGTDTRIRTVLGSCIAISLWHPVHRIGGMSHCLLPSAGRTVREADWDGRYVDEALPWLLREAQRHGTRAPEYQIKLFGGSNMFGNAGMPHNTDIGRKNASMARELLASLKLPIQTHDVGGTVSRSLIFEVSTGDVWVRRGVVEDIPPPYLTVAA